MTNFESFESFESLGSLGLLSFFGSLGMPEMIIFALVVLLLFGGAKLPGLMRNMGRSINEFKTGMNEKPEEKPRKVDDASSRSEIEKPETKSEEIVNH